MNINQGTERVVPCCCAEYLRFGLTNHSKEKNLKPPISLLWLVSVHQFCQFFKNEWKPTQPTWLTDLIYDQFMQFILQIPWNPGDFSIEPADTGQAGQ